MARTKIKTADITANAVTTTEILDANVTLAKIADAAANTVLVRDASSSGVVSAKAVATTEILIGDGTGFTAAALSGDTTMTNAGAVTIADNAVSLAKMAGLVRGKLIVGDASGDPSALTVGTVDQVLTSDGTDASWADLSGGTSWQSVVTASTLTAVAGNGYPINTTSNACTVTLPAGSVGDVVEIIDYAGTAATNNISIAANGSENIQGATTVQKMQSTREGVRLVYVDATQGWVVATTGYVGTAVFEPFSASGGTESTSGDYTIHTFNTSSTFVVSGGEAKSCDILALSGGAAGGAMGGGGAGGHYEFTETVTSAGGNGSGTYTVTVGGGGAGSSTAQVGASGVDSLFHVAASGSTKGGGGGGNNNTANSALDGGCGGGGNASTGAGPAPGGAGSGNTPSRSPSQGFDGGAGSTSPGHSGGGGGGAGAVGGNAPGQPAGQGGAGKSNSYSGSAVTRGGGGGGAGFVYHGSAPRGTGGSGGGGAGGQVSPSIGTGQGGVNQGGGGGGASYNSSGTGLNFTAGAGGSGVVIIRYLT